MSFVSFSQYSPLVVGYCKFFTPHVNSMPSTSLRLFINVVIGCRHLAESYSLQHATMAHPHKPCDFNDAFYENKGITNGADWYSVKGGMTVTVYTLGLLLNVEYISCLCSVVV